MLVVVDVIHTVAVIAVTLGAIAELHIRVLRICFAADGALMNISFFFVSCFGGLLKIHRLLGMLVLKPALPIAKGLHKIRPEEDEEIENGHKRQEGADPIPGQQTGDNVQSKEGGVDPGQPLDLYRKNIKQQYLHIWVKNGEGKEQGEVDIVHGGVSRNQAVDDIKHYAAQVEHVEAGCTPFPLQEAADPVIEVGGEDYKENAGTLKKEKIAALGKKYKGDEPPDLPMKNIVPGKIQKSRDPRSQAEGVQKIDHHISNGNIQHQVRYAKTGMIPAKLIDPLFNRSHNKNLLGKELPKIVTAFQEKVKEESMNFSLEA